MSYITLKCKNCGANMSLNTESQTATCNHCGSTFLIADLLDEKDARFLEKFSPKDLEQKMKATDALRQGETFLYQCEYSKAEASFKKAIEYDDSNFRSYLGVVKAKTKNYNVLPKDGDYLQYAHYALSLATGDDLILVKSELSKIDLLEREAKRQRRIFTESKRREDLIKQHRKDTNKVFSIITIFIILMIGCFIFACSLASDFIFKKPKDPQSIQVNSYESLSRVLSNSKYLDYDIELTSDIDCAGNTFVPFGTHSNAFTGSFNGNNHKISNATIDASNKNYAGLFGYTILADIKNLVLDKITLSIEETPKSRSTSAYGLLVGKSEASTITNVEIKNTCKVSISRDISYQSAIGGMIGAITNSSFVSGISSHTSISVKLTQITHPATSYVGGIIGTTQNSIVTKTCSNSEIYSIISNLSHSPSTSYASGIIGSILAPSLKDVLNVDYNHFSGHLTLTTSDIVVSKLSAITYSSQNAIRMLNNGCLYTSNNFYSNLKIFPYQKLEDFEINEYFVDFCISNDTYLAMISRAFVGWNNTNTFEPSLI